MHNKLEIDWFFFPVIAEVQRQWANERFARRIFDSIEVREDTAKPLDLNWSKFSKKNNTKNNGPLLGRHQRLHVSPLIKISWALRTSKCPKSDDYRRLVPLKKSFLFFLWLWSAHFNSFPFHWTRQTWAMKEKQRKKLWPPSAGAKSMIEPSAVIRRRYTLRIAHIVYRRRAKPQYNISRCWIFMEMQSKSLINWLPAHITPTESVHEQ